MKKANTIGNYNIPAAKAAMKYDRVATSATIFCHVSGDGKIYITNGCVLFTLTPDEYEEIIRPITKCYPGDWTISPAGKLDCDNTRFADLFDKAVEACAELDPLEETPLMLSLKDNKNTGALYYNHEQFACFNTVLVKAFADFEIRYSGEKTGAVVYRKDGEPFALVMPIRAKAVADVSAAERAIRAYYDTTGDADTQNTAAQNKLSAELSQKEARIAELEKALAEAQNAATQNAPAEKPDCKTAAEEIAAKWAAVAGLDVTVKGAQTAAPLVWISGDTKTHAKQIENAGGKWSVKRSAYYFKVA